MATISNSRLVPVASTGREAMQLFTRSRAFLTRDCETRPISISALAVLRFCPSTPRRFCGAAGCCGRGRSILVQKLHGFPPKGLRRLPHGQKRDILLSALHAADVGAIDAHPLRHGFLAEPCREPIAAHILMTKHEPDIHPDGINRV